MICRSEKLCEAVSDALKPHLLSARVADRTAVAPLGTSELADETIRRKTVNYRYFLRYLLPKWFSGAWREPTFFFSQLGRLFLKEGYSAGVMRVIYDRDEKDYGLLDRIFLEYSLHRASLRSVTDSRPKDPAGNGSATCEWWRTSYFHRAERFCIRSLSTAGSRLPGTILRR